MKLLPMLTIWKLLHREHRQPCTACDEIENERLGLLGEWHLGTPFASGALQENRERFVKHMHHFHSRMV